MPATIVRHVLFGAFTLTCMLTAAGLARAEVVNLKASMDAKSEVPPNSSPADGDLRYEQQKVVLEGQLFRTDWTGNRGTLSFW
jgi:hypothetical protein